MPDVGATFAAAGANTIRAMLAGCGLPRLEGRMLLSALLGRPHAWLVAHDSDTLPMEMLERFNTLAQRRRDGEPMAYLLGTREFMGHEFQVTPAVLIPRPDTEVLVEQALAELQRLGPGARVLDMGTGSGAIAISLALAAPQAQVTASDASPAALAVAQDNARRLGATVEFLAGDWFAALQQKARYDLIVSNPPYVASGDPHLELGDVRYEPRMALTDEADGLADIRVIAAGAPAWLNPGGALWLEHGWDQAPAVREILSGAGFLRVNSHADLAGIDRISGGYL
ncbi:Release factor glutamine methyltransferase [Kerstersia similis]